MKAQNILETIGQTPHVRMNRLFPGNEVWIKAERANPAGSIKDRIALAMVEDAERSGALQPGGTIIEPTSGNTGIGLAMVCAARGYPLVLCMAENFSIERRKILRFLGARVVLTPAALKGSGMVGKAEELAAAHGWFLVRQFENEANADAHSRTTALEILEAFADAPLDYFVTGYGTGGTVTGVARVLRKERPETKIILTEPANAQLVGSGKGQERTSDGAPAASHPASIAPPMLPQPMRSKESTKASYASPAASSMVEPRRVQAPIPSTRRSWQCPKPPVEGTC